jgi:hypothetical protein
MWHFLQRKDNKVWIWKAYDRTTGRVFGTVPPAVEASVFLGSAGVHPDAENQHDRRAAGPAGGENQSPPEKNAYPKRRDIGGFQHRGTGE